MSSSRTGTSVLDRIRRLLGRRPGKDREGKPGRLYSALLHIYGPADHANNPFTGTRGHRRRAVAREQAETDRGHARANARRRRWNRWLRGHNPVPSYPEPPADRAGSEESGERIDGERIGQEPIDQDARER